MIHGKAAVPMTILWAGGTIGIFLWDYVEGMEMLRYFWDAVIALDKDAEVLDEGDRFPLCREGQLESLVREVGLRHIEARAIEVTTLFHDFDDYWMPFLGKVGPAPSYVMSLNQRDRQQLMENLRGSLPISDDGSISLRARAWAVKGFA